MKKDRCKHCNLEIRKSPLGDFVATFSAGSYHICKTSPDKRHHPVTDGTLLEDWA